jgi:hypothetical protein
VEETLCCNASALARPPSPEVERHRKAVGAAKINVLVTDGADIAQRVDRVARGDALAFSIHGALQALSVLGYHAVVTRVSTPEVAISSSVRRSRCR